MRLPRSQRGGKFGRGVEIGVGLPRLGHGGITGLDLRHPAHHAAAAAVEIGGKAV